MNRRLLFGGLTAWLAISVAMWGTALVSNNSSRKEGRIEGILMIDGKPAPKDVKVGCEYLVLSNRKFQGGRLATKESQVAATDAAGKFVFPSVQHGPVTLGRMVNTPQNDHLLFGLIPVKTWFSGEIDQERQIIVPTRQTVQVTLGDGVVIRGQLALPAGITVAVDSANLVEAPVERKPPVDIISTERERTLKERVSDSNHANQVSLEHFVLKVSDDGEFMGHALTTKSYQVEVELTRSDGGKLISAVSQPFVIPAPTVSAPGVIDVGEIAVEFEAEDKDILKSD